MKSPSSSPPPRPTDSELTILRILWNQGPCSVREVCEAMNRLPDHQDTGYTTALKFLQIMHEKGLAGRDESSRRHLYFALAPREEIENQAVTRLADKLFGGATAQLALRALSTQKATPEELSEIRDLLDRLDRETPEKKDPS